MKALPVSSITPRFFPNLHEAQVYAIFNQNSTFALIPQEATLGEEGERRFTIDVRRQTNNEWEGFISH